MTREEYNALEPEERQRLYGSLVMEEQADQYDENPPRLGMTQEQGEANAALLRQEAEELRRAVPVRLPVPVVTPWRSLCRPVARRPRARVRRATRRATAHGPPGRSTDDGDPEPEQVGPFAAVTP
jgi:hypothetical protein